MPNQMPTFAVTSGGLVFYIRHEEASTPEPNPKSQNSVTVGADGFDEINSLVTISFETNGQLKQIFFFCSIDEFGRNFGLVFTPSSSNIFIGGGKLSAVINIRSMEIIRETINSCMFWRFEQINNHVVEFGEVECYLYGLNGEKIDDCVVDPPYEYEVEDDEITFQSPVFGKQSLQFIKIADTAK